MGLFAWRSEYSIKHDHLDSQHKELFRLAEELHAAMMSGSAKSILRETLKRLIDYTRSHFRDEEAMMLKAGYPQYYPHKAQHDKFTAHVLELQNGFEAGGIAVTVETLRFLRDWLENHIMRTDKTLASFFENKGSPELTGAGRR